MKSENTVLEQGIVTTDIPKERNRTDTSGGNIGDIVRIVLQNNSVTECSYVVFVLVEVDFGLTLKEAEDIMWYAHFHDQAILGYYEKDKALKLMLEVAALNARCSENLNFILQ